MKGDEERTRRAVELQPQKSELDGQSTVHFVWAPPSVVGGGCAERRCKRRGDEVDNSKGKRTRERERFQRRGRSEACLLFVNWVVGLHFGNCFDNQSSLDQEPNRDEV